MRENEWQLCELVKPNGGYAPALLAQHCRLGPFPHDCLRGWADFAAELDAGQRASMLGWWSIKACASECSCQAACCIAANISPPGGLPLGWQPPGGALQCRSSLKIPLRLCMQP